MKNLWSKSVMSILLTLCSLCANARTVEIDGICYSLDNGVAQVTYKLDHYEGEIIIPSSIVEEDEVTYPVTSIGEGAFRNCEGLTSVSIPNSIINIGEDAFSGCTNLTSITIPNSVSSIGWGAFDGTSWLEKQENGVVYAGNVVYKYKGEMPANTTITLKDGTIAIAEGAFYGCGDLVSIIIPNSVCSIGKNAFGGTSWFEKQEDGVVYAGNVAYKYKGEMPANKAITLKDGTIAIAGEAFAGYGDLVSFTIPNSVINIGDEAFSGCSNLESLVIVGEKLESIGKEAFKNCSSLSSVRIPKGVKYIGKGAFRGCDSMTFVTLNSNALCSQDYDGWDSGMKSIFGQQVQFYLIGEGVTTIGAGAFMWCGNLTSVIFFNNVTSIGEYAFLNCHIEDIQISDLDAWCRITFAEESLNGAQHLLLNGEEVKDLVIPNSVTSINDYAFNDFVGLTSVTIPSSVTSIGDGAFSGCSGITSVTIPGSVTTIGDGAFSGCSGITSVTIPDGVKTIGDEAFRACGGLTSVSILGSVTTISSGTFSYCTSLTSVNIPNGVTSIGDRAFYQCSNLTSVTIPQSVKNIGINAFWNCKKLGSIISQNPTPPVIEEKDNEPKYSAFAHEIYSNAVLRVPKGSAALYKAAGEWKNFKNVEELDDETAIEDVMMEKIPEGNALYNLNGMKISAPQKRGVNIIRMNDGKTKKILVK